MRYRYAWLQKRDAHHTGMNDKGIDTMSYIIE